MDVALMLISLLSSIISLIGLAWFRPLKQQQKVVKKTIYFFLILGFSASILHVYLYSGFF
ncbi:hypothetical protein BKG92_07485 [Rodentibacter ratti]|uniref:Uncharacterized protein n=1 Tax=Rodentibacter ratti TaxID=1906745 RepID=A0A1V3KW76_9PAST|nr:hypothetical protein [Rodentibacter ratti]OOF81956.1 hypothetical protein BKG92_07485 [Rodentibacter ratti]